MDKKDREKLARLVAWQFAGFVVLEAIVVILILVGLLPPYLDIKSQDGMKFIINSGFLIVVSLIVILTANLWLAILVEVLRVVEMKK